MRIVVTGLIAQHPTLGGVTWDYLQYVLGLAQLGHEVYYFEDSGEWPYNFDGGPDGDDWVARNPGTTVELLAQLFRRYELDDRWAYRFPLEGGRWFGLSDARRAEVLGSADLLLNVSGTLEAPERYRGLRRLAYLDSDPGFTQVKLARGDADFSARVNAHDVHFTFGGAPSWTVPATGHVWRPTRQPVVLSEWEGNGEPGGHFTTVMNWTSYPPLTFDGRSYGQKDIELQKFLELPKAVAPLRLELAMGRLQHGTWQTQERALPPEAAELCAKHPEWTPADLLEAMGWRVADPAQVCGNLEAYRAYVRSSKAEWSVAKNGYVRDRTGWFSCRSACYLAAGRPVAVQETGFSEMLPTGEGILPFASFAEAWDAVLEIERDYARHARAAREIAHEYFDARKVLAQLIEEAMAGA